MLMHLCVCVCPGTSARVGRVCACLRTRSHVCVCVCACVSGSPWLMYSVTMQMGSSDTTAYSCTSFSCRSFFMTCASIRKASGDMVPGFRVLMATRVVPFHVPTPPQGRLSRQSTSYPIFLSLRTNTFRSLYHSLIYQIIHLKVQSEELVIKWNRLGRNCIYNFKLLNNNFIYIYIYIFFLIEKNRNHVFVTLE